MGGTGMGISEISLFAKVWGISTRESNHTKATKFYGD